ncbi:hypothetical protein FOFC_19345 [Fusarium oxysporum]|nr:hypothetical protein FOFC_19345 [Fusarium oxysporum]
MFERLPQELLKFIISEMSIKDVKTLPFFYSADPLGICSYPGMELVFTKSIGLRFVIENNARACPHDQRLQTCQEASDEETVDELGSFVKFKEVILSLLEKCEKEQLTSFSWRGLSSDNLKVFAAALKNNKPHLQTLELDLVDWPYMRKALGYRNDAERVHGLPARDYIDKMVLGLDIRSPQITFPNLHTLVLSHVPMTTTLIQTIDFEVLRSLTIMSCPHWYIFVLAVEWRQVPVKLKKLEIQESWPQVGTATDVEHSDPTEILLDYFQGLEEFYLDQAGAVVSKYTWESLCHHSSTLKRFVNHSRFYDEELEDWTDLPDMMISERDKEGYRDDPTSSPLYPLNLEFIELSCEPINLLGVLNPFSRKDCLRIVHVRQSRKNMEYTSRSWGIMVIIDDEPVDETPAVEEGENPSNEYLEPMFWAFVEWAFSYKGIKSLEYILFGDYGRPEQMSRGNLLICREGYGSEDFRIIRESCPAPKWDYVKKE